MKVLVLGEVAYGEPWRVAVRGVTLDFLNTHKEHKEFDLGQYDAVQFTGGADVSPILYGETNYHAYDHAGRDLYEVGIFLESKRRLLPCFGICRGSQFLRVMCGGKLLQDIDGHGRAHHAQTHDGREFEVTSTHHQQAVPDMAEFFDHLTADGGTVVEGWNHIDDDGHQCYAVQYHPEYMPFHSEGFKYYVQMIQRGMRL